MNLAIKKELKPEDGMKGEGFAKKMFVSKTKTGDECLLVLKNIVKEGELTISTTDPQNLNHHQRMEHNTTSNSSLLNSIPVPSFIELAQASLSKSKRTCFIPGASADEILCQICKFESTFDVASDSLWIGCVRKDKSWKECTYWVHSVCKGFANASKKEIQRLNYYCPDHNMITKEMSLSVVQKGRVGVRTRGAEKDIININYQ